MLRTKVLVVGAVCRLNGSPLPLKNGTDTILIEKNLSFIKPCGRVEFHLQFSMNLAYLKAIIREIRKVRFVSPEKFY